MAVLLINVTGHVQGVGFRFFVQRTATIHGLTGEVWNRRDGSVEIIAVHEDTAVLYKFSEELKKGPGRPEYVHSIELDATKSYSGFEIGVTR